MIFPLVNFEIPHIVEINVVFPAPFGPKSAKISAFGTLRLTNFKASKPFAYDFDKDSICKISGNLIFYNKIFKKEMEYLCNVDPASV